MRMAVRPPARSARLREELFDSDAKRARVDRREPEEQRLNLLELCPAAVRRHKSGGEEIDDVPPVLDMSSLGLRQRLRGRIEMTKGQPPGLSGQRASVLPPWRN